MRHVLYVSKKMKVLIPCPGLYRNNEVKICINAIIFKKALSVKANIKTALLYIKFGVSCCFFFLLF